MLISWILVCLYIFSSFSLSLISYILDFIESWPPAGCAYFFIVYLGLSVFTSKFSSWTFSFLAISSYIYYFVSSLKYLLIRYSLLILFFWDSLICSFSINIITSKTKSMSFIFYWTQSNGKFQSSLCLSTLSNFAKFIWEYY